MSWLVLKDRVTGATEFAEQCAVIEWADRQVNVYPQLASLFAVPNGEKRERIKRVRRDGSVTSWSPAGVRAKRMGARAGVPDLLLPVPMGGWSGLAIEMKVGSGKPSDDQVDWLMRFDANQWCVWVCYSAETAIRVLEAYCSGGQSEMRRVSADAQVKTREEKRVTPAKWLG